MPPKTKTLAVDFDAVISVYKGWIGQGIFGPPVPGAIKHLKKLKKKGWKIIIFTTRGETRDLIEYCQEWEIPYDDINRNSENPIGTNYGKPMADVYLDDRALTFTGNWEESYKKILEFKPYYGEKL